MTPMRGIKRGLWPEREQPRAASCDGSSGVSAASPVVVAATADVAATCIAALAATMVAACSLPLEVPDLSPDSVD